MGIKKVTTILLVVVIANSFSQTLIRPFLGVSTMLSRSVGKVGSLENSSYMTGQNYGFELETKINLNYFGFSLKNTMLGMGAGVKKEGSISTYYRVHKIGTGLLNLGFYYSHDLIQIHRKKIIPELLFKPNVIVLKPIVGINLLKSEKNTDWYGANIIIGDTSYFPKIEKDDWEVSKFVGKSFYGFSINLGTSIHFYSKTKELFSIRANANLGFIDMLKTEYEFKEIQEDGSIFQVKGTFASRGSNLAFDLSIPITILNKKGERFRDRHSKL